jgi:flagellar protein FlgJ
MEPVNAKTDALGALPPQALRTSLGAARTTSTSAPGPPAERLEQACADMEALFVSYLFKSMRASIPEAGLLDGGHAEDLYTSMLDEEVARQLSRQGGLGVQQMLRRQLRAIPQAAGNDRPAEGNGCHESR